jgi:hypothetical protein
LTYTANYNLGKPAGNENIGPGAFNDNADIIDTQLKANHDAAAAKAAPSSAVLKTLSAASWVGSSAPYTQALTVTGLGATQNGTISIAQSATATQRAAALKAKLSATGQAAGTLTVTADGTKPTVDIPVTVILLG